MGKGEGGFALHSPRAVANLTNRQGIWEPLGLEWEAPASESGRYNAEGTR